MRVLHRQLISQSGIAFNLLNRVIDSDPLNQQNDPQNVQNLGQGGYETDTTRPLKIIVQITELAVIDPILIRTNISFHKK